MAEPYRGRLKSEKVDRLFEAVLSLKDMDECYRFFEDLCTIREVRVLAQRLDVAKMLAAGRTYEEIAHDTGMSTATISRINRFLQDGADGYRMVIERTARGGKSIR